MATARLNVIEDKIAESLNKIQGQVDADTGYQYHTTTGTIHIYDEAVSLDINKDLGKSDKAVNYTIEQDGSEEASSLSEGQNRLTNEVDYIITARLHNDGDEPNPKRSITTKMNEVLSDLKRMMTSDYTLQKEVYSFEYIRSTRVYNEDNDIINSGDLEVTFRCLYAQSWYNPDIDAC
jgi:hypothetical protein